MANIRFTVVGQQGIGMQEQQYAAASVAGSGIHLSGTLRGCGLEPVDKCPEQTGGAIGTAAVHRDDLPLGAAQGLQPVTKRRQHVDFV